MTDTKRLQLPLIDAAQSQKHITHNEALARLDGLVHLSALSLAKAPPATPAEDARYLVDAGGTGVFAGKATQVAMFQNGGFVFLTPKAGWRCFVQDSASFLVFDGVAWVDLIAGRLEQVSRFGVGTKADDVTRLSIRSNNALFAAVPVSEGGSGDLRFKLNKEQPGASVSQLYQSNWSGRAETGLMGSDSFRIKVSADGSVWKDALVIDPASASVSCSAPLLAPRIQLSDAQSVAALPLDGSLFFVSRRARGSNDQRQAAQSGDMLGGMVGQGFDGANFVSAAALRMEVDGTPAAGVMPGRVIIAGCNPGATTLTDRLRIDATGTKPALDNIAALGGSANRWASLYVTSGAISTSDEREKTDIAPLHAALSFLRLLRPVAYRWKIGGHDVDAIGDVQPRMGQRIHFGLIAQEVHSALQSLSMDAGLYVYDAQADRHGLRYEQFIAPVIAALQELDQKIEALSARLSN